jgi:hypothetical protein
MLKEVFLYTDFFFSLFDTIVALIGDARFVRTR